MNSCIGLRGWFTSHCLKSSLPDALEETDEAFIQFVFFPGLVLAITHSGHKETHCGFSLELEYMCNDGTSRQGRDRRERRALLIAS